MRLVDAVRAGGWPESEVGNALAIVSREDPTGDPCQPSWYNQFGSENSWGLFQINLMAHTQYTVAQVCDPVTNSRIAWGLRVSAGNYRDWSTTAQALGLPPYGSATYSVEQFAALASVDVGGGGPPAPGGDGPPLAGGWPGGNDLELLLALAVAAVILAG